ncbi:hypothetical protein QWZ13_08810 [Reinekea marina]|uniref:Uncharacterized protein n=1 Tax=Reinekea marina TaxID=1310421 RepID=A0ABV7WSF9_9GAMM|nr:hypothetical protein [Reinekea marina]MDN3649010.1 hypothetical protein [Reinekea marina]
MEEAASFELQAASKPRNTVYFGALSLNLIVGLGEAASFELQAASETQNTAYLGPLGLNVI